MERFVVGVDGSTEAAGAVEWAIALARRDGAEVIAVLAIAPPTYLDYAVGYGTPIEVLTIGDPTLDTYLTIHEAHVALSLDPQSSQLCIDYAHRDRAPR